MVIFNSYVKWIMNGIDGFRTKCSWEWKITPNWTLPIQDGATVPLTRNSDFNMLVDLEFYAFSCVDIPIVNGVYKPT